MRGMSNKTLKGASRDKDKLGVRSRGNSRSKGRGPCNQPGSAPRELESGVSWDTTRFVHEGVGGWPPAHEPLLKPATPPKATQRQGVIPGRVRGRPQGCQPRGTAVFNEQLGPEARPGNVPESAEAASPALRRAHPGEWAPHPASPLLKAVSMSTSMHTQGPAYGEWHPS